MPPHTTHTPEEVAAEREPSELEKELTEWQKLGIDPVQAVKGSQAATLASLQTIQFFLEELGITEERLEAKFNENHVKILRDFREAATPQIEQMRRDALAAQIAVPSGMLDSRGKPLIN